MEYTTPKLVVSRRPGVQYDLARWAERDLVKLPFKSVLSLEPLIEFWEQAGAEEHMAGASILLGRIRDELARQPQMRGELKDIDVLRGHREFLDLLMMPVIPTALRERELTAAVLPFKLETFYCTPPFERFLVKADGKVSGEANLDVRTYTYGKLIAAYLHILRSVYGVEVPFDFPLLFTAEDPETGLDRYFKVTSDLRFLKINQVGEAPTLTEEVKRKLLTNLADLKVWMELIPPDAFEFYGFDIIQADDVTDVEVVSLLQRDLLEGETLVSGATLPTLRQRMRVLLRQPGVQLGLAAVEKGEAFLLHRPLPECPDCLFRHSAQYDLSDLSSSLVARALRSRTMQVVDDLQTYGERTALEDEMLEAGARSVIAAPLYGQGAAVGVLYLWSEEPGALSALNMMTLLDVLPLFAAAMRRSKEELQNRVQSVILGEYTAIHSSVEWRFRKAALNYIQRQEMGLRAEVEPIVFHDVYPLYAATDIRRSSTHRMEAVEADLLEHLAEVDKVLKSVHTAHDLPILEYLEVRTERFREAIQGGLSSGDEANVRDFLSHDLDPVLQHFRTDPSVRDEIQGYYQALDPEHGRMYRRHREYDESVTQINRTISAYLDAEEEKAQAAYPHYFEKHQ
ncbi:MAG TPA: GAF domain-containing protein, partial [Rhodothermales bacterium]|nr:GAF domain-containing protein [Rhodothermales bacterium]